MTHVLVAALFTSVGWACASYLITRSLRDDIERLDMERDSIERQKKMIDAFLDGQVEDKRVMFDLGAHRRKTGAVS